MAQIKPLFKLSLHWKKMLLSHESFRSGKSVAKLNGEIVSSKLREFCSEFVDIHGQYDNQQIPDPENHILITDSYNHGSIELEPLNLVDLYKRYHEVKRIRSATPEASQNHVDSRIFYQFEFDYIDNLDLQPGEDDELREQLDLMQQRANSRSCCRFI